MHSNESFQIAKTDNFYTKPQYVMIDNINNKIQTTHF